MSLYDIKEPLQDDYYSLPASQGSKILAFGDYVYSYKIKKGNFKALQVITGCYGRV